MTLPTARARRLRADGSPAERLLWGKLRDRRLAGWKFRRQMPVGRYIVDFCCLDACLIVELDGGQHSEAGAVARDRARTAALEDLGYLVIRFWNKEVFDNLDGVCETIRSMLHGASTAVMPGSPLTRSHARACDSTSPHWGEGLPRIVPFDLARSPRNPSPRWGEVESRSDRVRGSDLSG